MASDQLGILYIITLRRDQQRIRTSLIYLLGLQVLGSAGLRLAMQVNGKIFATAWTINTKLDRRVWKVNISLYPKFEIVWLSIREVSKV